MVDDNPINMILLFVVLIVKIDIEYSWVFDKTEKQM